MKITYWADYACPYCYIGETSLKHALCNLGLSDEVSMEMKAFELQPDGSKTYEGPMAEVNARRYGYPVDEIRKNIETVNQQGKNIGLDMHYDRSRYTNTFDAHRLTKLAESKGNPRLTDAIQERLFTAYFTESAELADHPTLIRLAHEVGMNPQEVQEMLNSDTFADVVRSDEQQAAANGINAVPFFVIDGNYTIPGALPVEQMEKVLMQIVARRKKSSIQKQS